MYFSVPKRLVLPAAADYSIKNPPFCTVGRKSAAAEVSDNSAKPLFCEENGSVALNTSQEGSFSLSLKLFDKIPIKTINVSIVPQRYVIPSGEAVGIKLYTEGLLVVAVSSVTGTDNREYFPARDAGLCEGDRILSVNGTALNSIEDFVSASSSSEPLTITAARDGSSFTAVITPILSAADNSYKIGVWVRDSTAGIGTLTYIDPQSSVFAALGHAITDIDTGSIFTVSEGCILPCRVTAAKKGSPGEPGELIGSFSSEPAGVISQNTPLGIYGYMNNPDISAEPIGVATRFQIREGEAYILCDVDGLGVREYSIKIVSVSKSSEIDNKGMVIEITDPELLKKTGGIVQGMSGSPIIQNGMLVGAVTHVCVNL